jgi:hypothetical protein
VQRPPSPCCSPRQGVLALQEIIEGIRSTGVFAFPTHAHSYQVDFATGHLCTAGHAALMKENDRVAKILRESQSKAASPFLVSVCVKSND